MMTQLNKVPAFQFKKVLVIDDNEVDRYIAERYITKFDFAEVTVLKESAEKGLEYLRSLKDNPEELPQLIFLDIRMPEMDGFEFLEKYEELPEVIKKHSIIIMLTTSLNPEDHERAKKNKYVKRFLNKPLDNEKFEMIRTEKI